MKVIVDAYPRSLVGEEGEEGTFLSTEEARERLMEAAAKLSPLYEAVTGPDWPVIVEELTRLAAAASARLEIAKGDDVARNQATIRVLRELVDLPNQLASELRYIERGLSTDG